MSDNIKNILNEMLNLNFNDCKDLINYLNKNARRISEARKDKTTTLLHVFPA